MHVQLVSVTYFRSTSRVLKPSINTRASLKTSNEMQPLAGGCSTKRRMSEKQRGQRTRLDTGHRTQRQTVTKHRRRRPNYLVKLSVCCVSFIRGRKATVEYFKVGLSRAGGQGRGRGRSADCDLPVRVDLQHRLVELRDLPVDERLQRLLQPVVVPLQLPLVLLLVRANQALVLAQGVLAPAASQSSVKRLRLTSLDTQRWRWW